MPVSPRLLLAAILPAALGAQVTPLTVGDLTAAPGSAVSGWLEVPAGVDAGTRLPLSLLRGAAPGPTLCVVAGILGGKGAPTVLLGAIRQELDPATLRGTLVLVHIANPPSWAAPAPGRGPDGKHLNRVFPGRADGTVTERIAAAVAREIVPKCDYLVDWQVSDLGERAGEMVFAAQPGLDPRVDRAALRLARAWRFRMIVADTAGPRDPARAQYLQTYAHLRGIPAITVLHDAPAAGDDDFNLYGLPLANLMGSLGLLGPDGDSGDDPEPTIWIRALMRIASPADGVWVPRIAPDLTVAAGGVLGELRDPFGTTIARVTAPADAHVLTYVAAPAVTRGAPLALLGIPGIAPPDR